MATKIQVRRDTTTNWTTYGAEVPAAGEFCYDTDAKTLKIGDGITQYRNLNVIADGNFDPTGVDDRYVFTAGDNMTGDLTLGTNKITLNATDGSAEFAGGDITLNADGSAEFAGQTTIAIPNVFQGPGDSTSKVTNLRLRSLTDVLFGGVNAVTADFRLGRWSNVDGSAYSTLSIHLRNKNEDPDNYPEVVKFLSNGNAYFAGDVTSDGTIGFNLEPDNDANYTITTDVDEEGNTVETRVYNGPTLDVKERLQNLISRLDAIEANEVVDDATDTSLLQLVASASARLDSLEARIAALEGGN